MTRHNSMDRKGRDNKRSARGNVTRPGSFRPCLEGLEDRTLPANRLDPLSNALSLSLGELGHSVQAAVQQSKTTLPVLNQSLSQVGELTNIVGKFQNVISNKLRTLDDKDLTKAQARATIQNAIFEALTHERILGDRNDDTAFRMDDVLVTPDVVDLDAGNVTIEVRLTGSASVTSQTFSFGTGLPGLPLEAESGGDLSVSVGFDYTNLKFGLQGGTFFLDTAAANEFTTSVTAALNYAEMTGIVGFLDMKAKPDPVETTQLQAKISFDVQGNAPNIHVDNRPRLGGRADIKLELNGTFTDIASLQYQIPSIATDFQLHWDLSGSRLDSSLSELGAEPTVNYNNVRVSMGEFLGKTLAPILKDLQTALKPLQPIFTVLNYRIPGLSDLMEAGGEGPVSLLTLAKTASSIGVLPPNIEQLVKLTEKVNDINTLVNSIAVIGDNAWLPVGSFNLNEANEDLRGLKKTIHGLRAALKALGPNDQLTDLKSAADDARSSLEDLLDKAPDTSLKPEAKKELKKLTEKITKELSKDEDGLKLDFPILQNPGKNALGLLLGKDADFVTFTAQYRFNAKVEESYKLFSFLGAEVRGFLRGELETLSLWFKMGYDSFGLRQYRKSFDLADFAKGFYLDTSRPLVHLKGGVHIGLAAEIPLIRFTEPIFGKSLGVSAGVEFSGGLTVDGSVRLPDAPGHRFRISDTADRLFIPAGTVTAGVKFEVVAHTPFPILDDIVLYSKTIASHTLLNLDDEFHKANPFKRPPDLPPERVPVILDLNAFPEANDGTPNRIYMEEVNGAFTLRAYNGSSQEPFFTSPPRPVEGIDFIRVLGGGDDDSFFPTKIGGTNFGGGRNIIIDGRGGHNSVEVRVSAPQSSQSRFVFTNGHVSGQYELSYQGIDEITAYAVGGHHTSEVRELLDGMKLTIHGSSRSNRFVLGNGTVGGVVGDLTLRGGSGTDEIEFNDRDNPFATRWVVTDDKVQRIMSRIWVDVDDGFRRKYALDIMDMGLNGIERVVIRGGTKSISIIGLGAESNRYQVLATKVAVTIHGGSSTDHYVLGSESEPDQTPITSTVTITDRGGRDTLVLNDRGVRFDPPFHLPPRVVYTVDPTTIRREETSSGPLGGPPLSIDFSGLEDVQIYGGHYPGTEYRINGFRGASNSSSLSVYTGAEGDVVTVGTYPAGLSMFRGSVILHDTGGSDRLTVNAGNLILDPERVLAPNGFQVGHTGFETLFVRAPRGASSVAVRGVSPDVHATIFGAAQVNLGAGRLANVTGAVSVLTDDGRQIHRDGYRGNATTALTVDDSLNPAPANYLLGPSSVSAAPAGGPPFFNATFSSAILNSLEFFGGSGGNAVTLTDTRVLSSLPKVVLNTGLGADTVTVEQTHTNVEVNGQDGADVVNVGKDGSVQGITRQLTVTNFGDWSTVNLDNSADLQPRTITLDAGTYGTVSGLAPGLIRFRRQDLRALNIWSGGGSNTFEVRNTAQSTIPGGSPTTIYPTLFDTVNVHGTTGPLIVDLQHGENQVAIGGRSHQAGNLNRVLGDITIRGREGIAGSFVYIADQTSTGRWTYALDAGQFSRTSRSTGATNARVHFAGAPLSGLSLHGGRNANHYLVGGTPGTNPSHVGDGVRVTAGPAADSLTLLGTGGDLRVDLGAGLNQQVAVGDVIHSLHGLNGKITISAASPVVARVTNEAASSEEQLHTIDRFGPAGAALTRYELRDGVYVLTSELDFPTISLLDFQHGRRHQQPTFVYGTPAGMTLNVRGAAGWNDVFTAGWAGTGVNNLLGPVNFYGQAEDNDYTYYYDYTTTTPHTYTIQTDPTTPTAQRIERDGVAPFTYHGGLILFSTARVGGNTAHVKSVPANIYLNMTFAQGDDVTIGSAASGAGGSLAEIRGPMAIQAYGRASVVLDNSGNLDTTPRRVTFSRQVSGGVPYNLIEGLTGSTITWYTDDATALAVRGGAADDTFAVKGVTTPGVLRLDGGGGVNTLDYSGYDLAQAGASGVVVNLRQGTATGLANIANIRDVVGSAGNDVLVGGGGNQLAGGAGRDLLIAGAVASLLRGGGGEDLLIAGTTAHDDDQAALLAILDEWASASDYLTGLTNLRAGLLAEGRAASNGAANDLRGEGDRDLFFASIGQDILDKADDESVVPV
jgi:hypothetical protein